MRRLSEADNRGLGGSSAGGRSGGRGQRRSQHHSGERRGGCGSRLSAGQRQQALLDEGLGVWGHLTQCWETSLHNKAHKQQQELIMRCV